MFFGGVPYIYIYIYLLNMGEGANDSGEQSKRRAGSKKTWAKECSTLHLESKI